MHPAYRADETRSHPADAGPAHRARRLAGDPLVREAVEVSSGSLAARLDRLSDPVGEEPGERVARRAAAALARYRLRMATRATPFGLLAGVAAVDFTGGAEETTVRLGSGHRRVVRPDRAWLTSLVTGWERRVEVLRHVRVTVNNLCFTRGDRLVLPYVPDSAGPTEGRTVQEVSVRHTPAVQEVLCAARTPVLFADLADRLHRAFPAAPPERAEEMLVQLVSQEILLTELRPPLEAPDPLAHVTACLAAAGSAAEAEALRAVARDLTAYAGTPLGEGRAALRRATASMRRLRPADQVVQVDLALDADIRLPRTVAEEAERAAALLWRLAPAPPDDRLDHYHAAFLERYGTARLVPVAELLDPDRGLGPPAGYRRPPGHRTAPRPRPPDAERDRVLAALAQEATLTGTGEVLLGTGPDDPVLAALGSDDGVPPPSLELNTQVLAASPAALMAGRFRMVVVAGGARAGATFGRFGHLLPPTAQDALVRLARTAHGTAARPVQMVSASARSRGGNVAQGPRRLDRTLPVGVFADRDDPSVLAPENVLVGADTRRLFVVDGADGHEVAPVVLHVLADRWNAPNLARFLREVSGSGVREWQEWQWGSVSALPWLPRVLSGRTVLSPARWRPAATLLDRRATSAQWDAGARQWRERWHVPDRVYAVHRDHRLELDLTDTEHLRLLRGELARHPDLVLTEAPAAAPGACGWLTGPQGAHRSELVIPLVRVPDAAPVPAPATPHRTAAASARVRPRTHLPGGEWLYARLHGAPERQRDILTGHLPMLTDTLPSPVDRWFFVRYRDGDDHHLRLRFHAGTAAGAHDLLTLLHDWAAGLHTAGLIARLTLDTYEPETERYGGPRALIAAERVFHADSLATLVQLRLTESGSLPADPLALAAAGMAHLVRAYWPDPPGSADTDEPPWLTWLLATRPEDEERVHFRRTRREAIRLVDAYGDFDGLGALPGGPVLLASWHRRAEAAAAYGRLLGHEGPPGAAPEVLRSLLHMQHNRLAGLDRHAERACLAVLRGAVAAHRDRRRWA
ncbi:lantibiotic dehydratase [Streptomyces fumanus]|uniref:lantibiotic dehydratase n=1 Tax=Streptomyces fumanus TaxID=67302 RepID=UPI00167C8E16|nr:lantibiotic dehydratase [Streptomyces fumanus]